MSTESKFTIEPLKRLLRGRPVANREFGFVFKQSNGKSFMTRKKFFSEEQLVNYVNKEKPFHAYLGPQCNEQDFYNWNGHELVFDIDIDQYDEVRACGCSGKNEMCDICWGLIQDTAYYIIDVLQEDFGARDVEILFSGRRGIHVWFLDEKFFYLTNDQRQGILEHLRLIQGIEAEAKIVKPPKKNSKLSNVISRQFSSRIYRYIKKPFILFATKERMEKIGLTKVRICKILQMRELKNIPENLIIEQLAAIENSKKMRLKRTMDRVISFGAPRIDEPSTHDTNRLMRLPGWTHGSTGEVVRYLDNKIDFPLEVKKDA